MQNKKPVSFWSALFSIMAAAFGVQKRKNMERDLNASNPLVYIVAALIFVSIFIGAILLVVQVVIPAHL
ncbi:DUF2970 domain-containing protein [Bermanella marisrubri]|uniref:DUF2970 domain-containing protein n=1 Tax=Bermanella marisrubri TaxID=207949 RepID=Q1N3L6_9GAMM|nr:DUF2970 domain-containing protein [Bermanella marisrubri]EAT12858.1 hypothetical protein RED65_12334 [Oceanobacter sp. RED65] [Bermanella marisrubri]QIZ83179.1 DUF2970 domain-containing protein [Bermanella marisrubri]